jgi:hypothetical protein
VKPAAVVLETRQYVVVEIKPNQFVVLTSSKMTLSEVSKRLGCGNKHICAEDRSGEIWTIERFPMITCKPDCR